MPSRNGTADLWLTIVWVTYLLVFLVTLMKRKEPHIFVANWFYLAFIVTIAVLHLGNNPALPVSVFGSKSYIVWGGVQDAMFQWWYGHNAVGFFLTAGFLAIMYYFIPKRAERPIYSYRLSIIHFWALIFLYIWAGPHHLHYTALPDWAQTLGMTFSIMLWMPSWGGMINGLMTLSGAWDKLRTDPVLRMLVVSVAFYGMSTFEGPMMSIKVGQFAQPLYRLDHRPRAFRRAGLGRLRLVRRALLPGALAVGPQGLYSLKLVNWHFWIATIGIVLYISAMWVSGILQGLMWRAYTSLGFLEYSFIETVEAMHPFYIIRAAGGALFLIGALIMAYNLWMTVRVGEAEVQSPRRASAGGMRSGSMSFWTRHQIFEKNSIILIDRNSRGHRDRRPGRDHPAVLPEEHDRDGRRHQALHAAGAGRPQHLRPRGLLSLPLADDPAVARRGRALRSLLAGGRKHVRPSVPVGIEADRAGSRARRRQIFRRLARHASDQSARDRAAVGDARLSVPGQTEVDTATSRDHLRTSRIVGVPYTDDQIANAAPISKAQADPDSAGRGRVHKALSEGRRPQLRRQAGRVRPKWTR